MTDKMAECFITPIEDDEFAAIRAVAAGTADEYNQRLAIAAIIHKVCRHGDLAFVPGAPDETAFFNGRQFVGTRLLRIINDAN